MVYKEMINRWRRERTDEMSLCSFICVWRNKIPRGFLRLSAS